MTTGGLESERDGGGRQRPGGREVDRLRVEYLVALRAVVDAMSRANGSRAAARAASLVKEHLTAGLLPAEGAGEVENG